MNPDSQRRLHVRRALLNKKNGANTQSFLCPLIQFAGVAKLHQRRLSDLLRHVICVHGILAAPHSRRDASKRQARRDFYRTMIAHHTKAQSLVREYRL
jgi:hypothetical protein